MLLKSRKTTTHLDKKLGLITTITFEMIDEEVKGGRRGVGGIHATKHAHAKAMRMSRDAPTVTGTGSSNNG